MKGVIVMCLERLVKEKFGKDKWEASLEKAGLMKNSIFLAGQDIDDQIVMQVLKNTCEVIEITLQQAADAFGEYWVNSFAPKIYKDHYKGVTSAKQFLKKMDEVHKISTREIEGAQPPRFDYEEIDDTTMIMTYKSHRGLIDIMIGLIKGVGKYFHEQLKVNKLNENKVEIIFLG